MKWGERLWHGTLSLFPSVPSSLSISLTPCHYRSRSSSLVVSLRSSLVVEDRRDEMRVTGADRATLRGDKMTTRWKQRILGTGRSISAPYAPFSHSSLGPFSLRSAEPGLRPRGKEWEKDRNPPWDGAVPCPFRSYLTHSLRNDP